MFYPQIVKSYWSSKLWKFYFDCFLRDFYLFKINLFRSNLYFVEIILLFRNWNSLSRFCFSFRGFLFNFDDNERHLQRSICWPTAPKWFPTLHFPKWASWRKTRRKSGEGRKKTTPKTWPTSTMEASEINVENDLIAKLLNRNSQQPTTQHHNNMCNSIDWLAKRLEIYINGLIQFKSSHFKQTYPSYNCLQFSYINWHLVSRI